MTWTYVRIKTETRHNLNQLKKELKRKYPNFSGIFNNDFIVAAAVNFMEKDISKGGEAWKEKLNKK